jgi:hypothetical protein
MTTGAIVVIAVRLIVPLSMFRWPLIGGIASMVVDALDVVIIELLGLGGFGDSYHQVDKLLDTYYLSIQMYIALGWESAYARLTAGALYAWRVLGVAFFELTQERALLLLFPNLFENWWLYCVVAMQFFPNLVPRSAKTTLVPLVILLIPKLIQEYVLHFREAQPWDWLKRNLL